MLTTINNLSNRYIFFVQKDYAIYVLDDEAVHLMPEASKAFFQQEYIQIVMGGCITGSI